MKFNGFQSYHTGIETNPHWSRELKRWNFQSYHTGIETTPTFKTVYGRRAFNRTILELKRNWPYRSTALLVLSIVPYWNWNEIVTPCFFSFSAFQSYHTGIETFPDFVFYKSVRAFNRTILELKHWNICY